MIDKELQSEGDHKQIYPYSPSWIDRLTDWIETLPGSSWFYYLGLAVLIFLIQVIVMWIENAAPIGTVFQFQVFFAGVVAFFLALFCYLDKWAGSALEKLKPELIAGDGTYRELYFQLTTLPMGSTILASIILLALNFISESISGPYLPEIFVLYPISANLMRVIYLICWILFGAFLFHTIHKLRMINQLHPVS